MSVTVDVDLRSRFGAVRDQGARPTCLAFAASDAHAAMRGAWVELSCEYAFYHAQKRTGRPPAKGAFLNDMLGALREEGQPVEAGWPYLTQLPTNLSLYCLPYRSVSYISGMGINLATTLIVSAERLMMAFPQSCCQFWPVSFSTRRLMASLTTLMATKCSRPASCCCGGGLRPHSTRPRCIDPK